MTNVLKATGEFLGGNISTALCKVSSGVSYATVASATNKHIENLISPERVQQLKKGAKYFFRSW